MNKFSLALNALKILHRDCILNKHIDEISPEIHKLNTMAFYSSIPRNYPGEEWRKDQILFFSLISHLSDKDLEECFPEISSFLPLTS